MNGEVHLKRRVCCDSINRWVSLTPEEALRLCHKQQSIMKQSCHSRHSFPLPPPSTYRCLSSSDSLSWASFSVIHSYILRLTFVTNLPPYFFRLTLQQILNITQRTNIRIQFLLIFQLASTRHLPKRRTA